MENKNRIFILLISVIVFVIASMTIPVLLKASQDTQVPATPPQQQGPGRVALGGPTPQGPEEAKQLKTAISIINIGLLIPLFLIYAGIYRRMRSSFTLGLLAVIFALGMYAVTSNPLIVSLLGSRTGDIGLFQIIPDLCTTAALVILIRISLE